ncbi:30S ribosomal protein S6 [Candidatus Synchoanobacter obligatus]|uniref:Multifunctional fusion protein n=1 Tax=Candidatus Synchoanobacter obligatus TaxID=2919597 RepID=A0ABT1L664_9GAMM|nr:30S ribosomal protein S6 [Candidatus Synchoanobacter obligatus]MCP8351943.1 30S ribosomal protein S6 [Candidatus Synchoanobacter obligatus]
MVEKKIYEMVLVINPAQSEQADETLQRYSDLVEEHAGEVIRMENWGRKKLAYVINRQIKGHYLYINFAATHELIEVIEQTYLKHNDAVLRHWIAKMPVKIEEKSPLYSDGEDSSEHQFTESHPEFYSFKNVRFLKGCIMETKRILPRRTTGLNARQQRQITRSIKVARILALIPYCDRHPDSL